ncbi:hypothetical protein WJX81_006533 [Elliptochloris bilobata]|uniref:BRCT domain-containing protein n=1 Tax=Elliptochloris bilobata TaxID=381761 RepID=A0AAW1SIE2_9CHLO
MAKQPALEGVVALVVARSSDAIDYRKVLEARLAGLGAGVAARFSREVTHVVFRRDRCTEREAEDAHLRELHERAAKAGTPVLFVEPLWVINCVRGNCRALEQKYVIPRPPAALLKAKTPTSGAGKKRKRSLAPRAAQDLELDVSAAEFSSSQQIAAPRPAPAVLPAGLAEDTRPSSGPPAKRHRGVTWGAATALRSAAPGVAAASPPAGAAARGSGAASAAATAAAAAAASVAQGCAEGPRHGILCMSSVAAADQADVVAALRRLRGVRASAPGREESVTHLVVGAPRRTLKVLLAVAAGAWLLAPEWVAASLEAGHWLPEAPFLAQVPFAAAAMRAREARERGTAPLMAGERVHVVEERGGSGGGGARGAGNGAVLRRVAVALGAKVVGARGCTLVVVVGAASGLPAGVPPGALCAAPETDRQLSGPQGERPRKAAAAPAAVATQLAPLAQTTVPPLLIIAPPAPLTTAMACELANAHAPYMQMGSVTVGVGAAAGVFERESVLLSEKRSPMSTQELTRHAANLGMLAAATANPVHSRHFYLGFQGEHRLTATGAQQLADLSGHKEVRMEAKVGVFGRGMASVKIQCFVEGQAYGMFKVGYLVVPEADHRQKCARALLSPAEAADYKEACASLVEPYKNVVRFDETSAPAADVRKAKFTIGDPTRVAGHFPDAPMTPASLLVGHGFETIALFADADMRLAAGYTVLSYKVGCKRMPWLNEQATVTTTRTGDESFRVEMSGAFGGKVLAFDVAIALHS